MEHQIHTAELLIRKRGAYYEVLLQLPSTTIDYSADVWYEIDPLWIQYDVPLRNRPGKFRTIKKKPNPKFFPEIHFDLETSSYQYYLQLLSTMHPILKPELLQSVYLKRMPGHQIIHEFKPKQFPTYNAGINTNEDN